jgi:hypothetical protein
MKKALITALSTLALGLGVFGGGIASATGEGPICTGVYPRSPGVLYGCGVAINYPQAATMRGTHSWSDIWWIASFYNSAGAHFADSPWHESLGLNWGPGVTIPAGTVKVLYTLQNYGAGDDRVYPHI